MTEFSTVASYPAKNQHDWVILLKREFFSNIICSHEKQWVFFFFFFSVLLFFLNGFVNVKEFYFSCFLTSSPLVKQKGPLKLQIGPNGAQQSVASELPSSLLEYRVLPLLLKP